MYKIHFQQFKMHIHTQYHCDLSPIIPSSDIHTYQEVESVCVLLFIDWITRVTY